MPIKESVYMKQRLYSVFLGNELTEYFSSHKAAKRYLAETNRFLNYKLHECNYLYSYIFNEYRKNWFYFIADNAKSNSELRKLERSILTEFKLIDKAFNLVVSRSHHINGNYFTWHHLYNVTGSMLGVIKILKYLMRTRKYYAESQRLEILKSQTKRLYKDLKNYGYPNKDQDKPDRIIMESLTTESGQPEAYNDVDKQINQNEYRKAGS